MNIEQQTAPKLCIIGDSNVGKTCIINRLIKGIFTQQNDPTIGNSFMKRTFYVDGHSIEISIWDTAGQERYRSVVSMYFRQCKGALIVYDITDKETFNNVSEWIKKLKEIEPDAEMIIVGNKEDLQEERKVNPETVALVAERYNCEYIEVSAKSNKNIKEVFDMMARKIYQKEVLNPSESQRELNILLSQPLDDEDTKKKCC